MYTFRREHLDTILNSIDFEGDIIDIGGKKTNKRGRFRPKVDTNHKWHYVNIESKSKPDICCDAEHIPIINNTYDIALLCEVIEHLSEPEKVISEIYRILKPSGKLILSSPFLFPIHADPYDFQRWTIHKLHSVLENNGFIEITITHMGGLGSVMHDLIFVALSKNHNIINKLLYRFIKINRFLFRKLDKYFSNSTSAITTGYFVCCIKKQ